MSRVKSEAVQEWGHAGASAAAMYGNFFFWLFREPFPVRQLGQQIVRVMLEGVRVILAVAGIVEGAMFAWLAGWDGTKFSAINWAGAVSLYPPPVRGNHADRRNDVRRARSAPRSPWRSAPCR